MNAEALIGLPLAGLLSLAFIAYIIAVLRLQSKHRELWLALGQPSVLGFFYPWIHSWAAIRLIWSRDASLVREPAFQVCRWILRAYWVAVVAATAVVIVAFLLR